jgi:hypothetical protein
VRGAARPNGRPWPCAWVAGLRADSKNEVQTTLPLTVNESVKISSSDHAKIFDDFKCKFKPEACKFSNKQFYAIEKRRYKSHLRDLYNSSKIHKTYQGNIKNMFKSTYFKNSVRVGFDESQPTRTRLRARACGPCGAAARAARRPRLRPCAWGRRPSCSADWEIRTQNKTGTTISIRVVPRQN